MAAILRGGAVLLVVCICVSMPRTGLAQDPWYEDMNCHWACDWVRLLWDEGVADGFLYNRSLSWGGYMYESTLSLFKPDEACSRAELTMLIAKAFRLTPASAGRNFTDVPPGLCAYNTKPAYPWIEAAFASGLVKGVGNGLFKPASTATRQEVIAMMVRGLGLSDFAATLSSEHVTALLSRFSDGTSVDAALRREVAAAIYLNIVEGYPDRTLKPGRTLSRAEAATIVARSCLIRAEARPAVFSPDGDLIEDSTVISLITLKNRSVAEWGLQILTTGRYFVRWWNGWTGSAGWYPVPSQITWDGRDYLGTPCGDGQYFYQAWVRDRNGHLLKSALKPVNIERPCLWVFASPASVYPGEQITICAVTSPAAVKVVVSESGTELQRAGGHWTTTITVPPDACEGVYHLAVRATYASSAVRQATAQYTVLDPLSVEATVTPNPALPGQSLIIRARTSLNVISAHVRLPWETAPLAMTSVTPGEHTLSCRVPRSWPEGSYAVEVTARSRSRARTCTITLVVTTEALRRFVPSLVT